MVLQIVIFLIRRLVEVIIIDLIQSAREYEDKDLLKELEESLDGIKSLVDPNIRRDPAAVRRRMRRLKYAAEDAQSILGRRRSTVIALQYSVDYLSSAMTLPPMSSSSGSGTRNLHSVGSFFDGVLSILQNEHVRSSDPMRKTLLDLQEKVKSLKNTSTGQERASGSRGPERNMQMHPQPGGQIESLPSSTRATAGRQASSVPQTNHRITRSTSVPVWTRRSFRELLSHIPEEGFYDTRPYKGGE